MEDPDYKPEEWVVLMNKAHEACDEGRFGEAVSLFADAAASVTVGPNGYWAAARLSRFLSEGGEIALKRYHETKDPFVCGWSLCDSPNDCSAMDIKTHKRWASYERKHATQRAPEAS